MAATPASAACKFRQQVYVDVPVSPYLIPQPSKSASTLRLKENTPLRPSNGGIPLPVSDMSPMKRKVSEHGLVASDPIVPTPKKQKLMETSAIPQHPTVPSNACPEFPNGFIYCHQCSRKRDALASIYCSSVTKSEGVEKRCIAKYCGPCLKNRYGEEAREIRSRGEKKSENGRIEHTRYTFTCPKCRNICNCWRCRKSKGLKPTGIFALHNTAGSSVAQLGPQNVKFTVGIPKKDSKKKVEVFISTTPSKTFIAKAPSVAETKPVVQKKLKVQTQTLPVLKWTVVPTTLDLEEAKARFQIREFVLRFTSVMKPAIPKTQLSELDDVGCDSRGQSDNMEMAPWVSEGCVRSMVLGLLGILVDKDNGSIQKPVESAIRDILAVGNNLSKIWFILSRMRDAIDMDTNSTSDSSLELDTVLSFPDPLPPPASAAVYNIRTTRSARDPSSLRPSIVIAHSAQMIPVVKALIEAALTTGVVREALDSGVKEAKEMTREVKDCIKTENEKWDAERKELELALKGEKVKEGEKVKTKTPPAITLRRAAHKHRVRNLENALKLVLPGFAPRFAPLGADSQGRVFWALSPGVNERRAALDFIASATSGSKEAKRPRHRGRALSEGEDHSGTREWCWFVVVWGKKFSAGPKLAEGKGKGKAADNDDEDADERWWGFYEPRDIRKVADWIRIDAGIDPYGDVDGDKPSSSLVKGLNEYAVLLEWRLKEGRYESQDISEGDDKRT